MSRKKEIITLVIGLVFISGIVLFKVYPSMSQASNSAKQTKTVAKAEVAKSSQAEENDKLAKSTESSSTQSQTGSSVARTTAATKNTAVQSAKSTAPQPAKTTQTAAPQRQENVSRGGTRTLYMVATGYTDAPEENYPWAGAPSYIGLPLARGIVAVDPNVIPMGTKLYVEGYGEAIAADQGGAIKGNRIDLFFDSKWEANTWGMKKVKVTLYQ